MSSSICPNVYHSALFLTHDGIMELLNTFSLLYCDDDFPSSEISPKLKISKIFDDFEFSFSTLVITVNVCRIEFSGIKNSISNNPLSFEIPVVE